MKRLSDSAIELNEEEVLADCSFLCYVEMDEALCKLKAYEDTGLTPEEVEQFKGCGWIPVAERMPEPEREVLITTRATYQAMYGKEQTAYFTCLAFYEDGTIWTEDSVYNFEDMDDCPYDEDQEDWKIPQGWWEGITYSEEFKEVDDEVIAWMPKPEPYKEEPNG